MRSERGLDAWRYAQARQQGAVLAQLPRPAATGPPGDALDEHYKSDRVITTLEIDMAARVWGYQQGYLCSDACLVPPIAALINATCCPTLYLCTPCCFPAYEAKVAAAHRLVLRERTLLFEVDEHVSYSSLSSLSHRGTAIPACCEPGGICPSSMCGTPVVAHRATIRLADVGEIRVESGTANRQLCTDSREPDQLVVTTTAGVVVAAIAGPKHAQAFIDAVQSQMQRVISGGLDASPPASSANLPGPGGLAMGGLVSSMMAMVGGMGIGGGIGGGLGGGGATYFTSAGPGTNATFTATCGTWTGHGAEGVGMYAPQQDSMQREHQPPVVVAELVPAKVVVEGEALSSTAGGGGSSDRGGSLSDELGRLASLHQQGVLSDEQFEQAKQHVISGKGRRI